MKYKLSVICWFLLLFPLLSNAKSDKLIVFKSLIPELSFFVKGDTIGLINSNNNEVIFENHEYPILRLYPSNSSDSYQLFLNEKSNNKEESRRRYSLEKINGQFVLGKAEKTDPNSLDNGLYENGIEKIGGKYLIHHYCDLRWENGKGKVPYKAAYTVKNSRFYDLENRSYLTENGFAQINSPGLFTDKETPTNSGFYQTIQVSSEYEVNDLGDWVNLDVKNPQEILRYGLLDKDFNEIIRNQKYKPNLINNEGFYITGKEMLNIFTESGTLLFKLENKQNPTSIIKSESYYYIAFDDSADNDGPSDYIIYSKDGGEVDKAIFGFQSWVKSQKLAIVSVKDSSNNMGLLYGFYDLEKRDFINSKRYNRISKNTFDKTILKCPTKECHYYYTGNYGSQTDYFDDMLSSFYPKKAIEIEEQTNQSEMPMDDMPLMLMYIIEKFTDHDNRIQKVFESKGVKIEYLINGGDIPFDEGWYGAIVDKMGPVSIMAVYSNENSKPKFGLMKEGTDYFLIDPIYDNLRFNVEIGQLELTLKDKKGNISLKRYDY